MGYASICSHHPNTIQTLILALRSSNDTMGVFELFALRFATLVQTEDPFLKAVLRLLKRCQVWVFVCPQISVPNQSQIIVYTCWATIQSLLPIPAVLTVKDHYKEQNFVLDAMRLKCSADRLGTSLPFHIIYGGGLMEPWWKNNDNRCCSKTKNNEQSVNQWKKTAFQELYLYLR